jgi:hypothetical protein
LLQFLCAEKLLSLHLPPIASPPDGRAVVVVFEGAFVVGFLVTTDGGGLVGLGSFNVVACSLTIVGLAVIGLATVGLAVAGLAVAGLAVVGFLVVIG